MSNKQNVKLIITLIFSLAVLLTSCSTGNITNDTITNSLTAGTTQKGSTTGISTEATTSVPQPAENKAFPGTVILGSPTDSSIAVNLLTAAGTDVYLQYGKTAGNYNGNTGILSLQKDVPTEVDINNLEKDTQYYYRVCYRIAGEMGFSAGVESTFHTQRVSGDTFSFGIQADSHPERINKMFDPNLYLQTMNNVKALDPDFYISLGDDFSIDPLITKNQLSQQTVDGVYVNQRNFLGVVGSSSPIFLVNGNHEEAAKYLLDGTANNAAVYAGNARTSYFTLPTPGSFYTGDSGTVQYIGLLKDYYSWTWGDALFVVLDPYWHSDVAVDNMVGSDNTAKNRDLWDVTIGDAQYKWFEQKLANSTEKYKFVFEHHVLGTGRGGIEEANGYEWGGLNSKGANEFSKMRPGWDLPIQPLMAKYGVTIFFQGHDHLFARQQLDGVTYQEVPIPADPTYTAFNSDAYLSGTVLPNSGFLNVTVSPTQVKVDYISSYLPKDETAAKKNGQVVYSYTIQGR